MNGFWSLSAAAAGGTYMQMAQPRPSLRAAATAAAGVAVAAAGTYVASRQRSPLDGARQPHKLRIPRPVIDALCGAIGEIAQVSVLYPLDTIKVRCQATGSSARQVVAGLLRQGLTAQVLQQLYAGVVSASLCSVAVGSLYYLSFCTAKRMAVEAAGRQAAAAAARSPPAAAAAAAGPGGGAAGAAALASSAAADPLAAAAAFASISASHSHAHSGAHKQPKQAAGGADAATGSSSAAPAAAEAEAVDMSSDSDGKTSANVIAALSAALVGAVVEAPLELFKHQTQAGLLQGNMLRNMLGALQASGPAALYTSLVPFCLKSLPFDMGAPPAQRPLGGQRPCCRAANERAARRAASCSLDPAQPSSSSSGSGGGVRSSAFASPRPARLPAGLAALLLTRCCRRALPQASCSPTASCGT
jgi:hypothetical protein